jgi:hypothetical protein
MVGLSYWLSKIELAFTPGSFHVFGTVIHGASTITGNFSFVASEGRRSWFERMMILQSWDQERRSSAWRRLCILHRTVSLSFSVVAGCKASPPPLSFFYSLGLTPLSFFPAFLPLPFLLFLNSPPFFARIIE